MEEKFFYDSTDNIKLCGLLNKSNNDDKIIILCHGLKGSKEERKSFKPLTEKLHENNINSFRFDFRGQGESTGNDEEMTVTKEIEDLEATINYLKTKGYEKFILLGASFGASIVSLLNYDNFKEVDALILWYGVFDYMGTTAPFFSNENRKVADEIGYYEIISKRTGKTFKLGKKLFDEVYSIIPYKNLIKTNFPKLFVHGTGDTQVPYELSIYIHNLCKNAKLELIKNGEHTFDDSEQSLNNAINKTIEFIKEMKY